jgi:riboflavin synthase alpha subunit
MAINARLFSGVLAATDTVAIAAVAANTVIRVNSITLSQPTGAATATVSIAINGTSLTAANVRMLQTLTTGSAQSVILYPQLVLASGDTLNISCTTAAQTNCTINGSKEIIS